MALQEYVQPQELGPLPYGTEELSLEEYSTDHFRMFQFKVRQAPRKPGLGRHRVREGFRQRRQLPLPARRWTPGRQPCPRCGAVGAERVAKPLLDEGNLCAPAPTPRRPLQ